MNMNAKLIKTTGYKDIRRIYKGLLVINPGWSITIAPITAGVDRMNCTIQ